MTDTSKSFARETLDEVRTKLTDYAALSAQLEAATARADRARDDALEMAAHEVTKAMAMQDAGYPINLATLRNAVRFPSTSPCVTPTASVEPVTVQEAARVYPFDLAISLRHAFLSGIVAANNIPSGEPCVGPDLWTEYDPYHPAFDRLSDTLAAIAGEKP